MHEVTHISYGSGAVEIVLDSASLTEVAALVFLWFFIERIRKKKS